ncbi:hypothetical protein QFZ94_004982 [Paraburkholderia sp. JPY465]
MPTHPSPAILVFLIWKRLSGTAKAEHSLGVQAISA